jgi:ABC-type multidrug transport system fused ATPase/permease subunit
MIMYSLERIFAYTTIEGEPKPTKEGTPPAYWPASGDLRVENLTARYSLVLLKRLWLFSWSSSHRCVAQDGPVILRNVSFRLRSGQRVGVVGRTGSGKVRICN